MDRREPVCDVWKQLSGLSRCLVHVRLRKDATVPIGSHLDGIERVYEISARTTMEDPIHTRRATRGTGSCWDMYNAHQSMGIAAAEDVF